jgi:hypothetical protein
MQCHQPLSMGLILLIEIETLLATSTIQFSSIPDVRCNDGLRPILLLSGTPCHAIGIPRPEPATITIQSRVQLIKCRKGDAIFRGHVRTIYAYQG